jgi:hypothetical protein
MNESTLAAELQAIAERLHAIVQELKGETTTPPPNHGTSAERDC